MKNGHRIEPENDSLILCFSFQAITRRQILENLTDDHEYEDYLFIIAEYSDTLMLSAAGAGQKSIILPVTYIFPVREYNR